MKIETGIGSLSRMIDRMVIGRFRQAKSGVLHNTYALDPCNENYTLATSATRSQSRACFLVKWQEHPTIKAARLDPQWRLRCWEREQELPKLQKASTTCLDYHVLLLTSQFFADFLPVSTRVKRRAEVQILNEEDVHSYDVDDKGGHHGENSDSMVLDELDDPFLTPSKSSRNVSSPLKSTAGKRRAALSPRAANDRPADIKPCNSKFDDSFRLCCH